MKQLNLFSKNKESNSINIKEVSDKDIAVIGIGINFPKASNEKEYWNIIRNKIDCVREIPESRKRDIASYLEYKNIEENNIKYAEIAYLDEIDKFDYNFFKISPKEARLMDPNQRLFLQSVWSAIEDAGYGGDKLVGSRTGVYVGFTSEPNYLNYISEIEPQSAAIAKAGNLQAVIAGRISYILDIKGPSLLINTACSSSLVAIHYACQDIRNGECDAAIVGSSSLIFLPLKAEGGIGIESSDGRARTFDDSSDGTGTGEGVATVLLKSLSKAIDDGDTIYAVIKGSAVNQDGRSNGLTAPNPVSQEEVIVRAWKNAEIDPSTIAYIEAHGTGTKLGDPIEIEGIQKAFSRYTNRKQFCAIGSIKTNIGHLDSAAGIVGFIKAVLALKYKEIPPTLHFKTPNRKINFEDSPVYISDKLMKWEREEEPRRCGISAFGLSGTNCHVILEEAPETEKSNNSRSNVNIFTLSAKSANSLNMLIKQYKEFIAQNDNLNLNDICYTANTCRGHYNYRVAMIVENIEDMKNKLNILSCKGIESNYTKEAIYYGKHSIIPISKEYKDIGEITLDEKINKDEEMNKYIERLLEIDVEDKENYIAVSKVISKLYVEGALVDWKKLYSGVECKVNLPTYQFEQIRCWVEPPKVEEKKEKSCYEIKWIQKDIESNKKEKCGDVLVIKDGLGMWKDISEKLKMEGSKVIEVGIGSEFNKINEKQYTISNELESYIELFNEVKQFNISKIIHLSTITNINNVQQLDELKNSQENGLYSLLNIIKATIHCKYKNNIEVVLVSNLVNEVTGNECGINPHNATLFGLAKVVGQEHLNLKCKCIDIDEKNNTENIIKEIHMSDNDSNIAYRNGKRYIEEIGLVEITSSNKDIVNFREIGVYIITGGATGIGSEIAKCIMSKGKVNIALIGRSKIPCREKWNQILKENQNKKLCKIISSIIEMEKYDSNITYYNGDVSQYSDMKYIMDDLKEKYGKINGIIHSAGVAGDGFMFKKDLSQFEKVVNPKVIGTWILDKLTEEDELDFFVLFSSISSVIGVSGQGDYAAANSYLDSYTAYRNKLGKRTLTINWPTWNEVGMAVEYGVDLKKGILKSISIKEGIRAFEVALNSNLNRVIIGEINYDELLKVENNINLKLDDKIINRISTKRNKQTSSTYKSDSSIHEKVVITGGKGEGYTLMQQKLAQIWSKVLGVSQVSIYDNFNDLGGDSILAVELLKEIDKEYPNLIDISDIFSYATIAEMSLYKEKELEKDSKVNHEDNIDSLLDDLANGDLNVDEVDKLIEMVGKKEWNY